MFYGYLRLTSNSVWTVTLAHGATNWLLAVFAALTVTASPLALSYLAGETGVLTLIASAAAAGRLLYRLGQGRRTAQQQIAPRVKANT